MAYCSKCGVEVEAERVNCPLCDVPIHRYDSEDSGVELSPLWPVQKELPVLKGSTKRFMMFFPLQVLISIAFLIILIVDIRMNEALTWSKYPLTAVGGAFSIVLGIILFGSFRLSTLAWTTLSVLVMLYLFDFYNGAVTWFTSISVPITLLAALYGQLTIVSARLIGRLYSAQFTLQSLLLSLLCLCIDWVVSSSNGAESFTWSLIVAAPLMVLFLLGIVWQFVMKKYLDPERFLHR